MAYDSLPRLAHRDSVRAWRNAGVPDAAQWLVEHPEAQWFGLRAGRLVAAFQTAEEAGEWREAETSSPTARTRL